MAMMELGRPCTEEDCFVVGHSDGRRRSYPQEQVSLGDRQEVEGAMPAAVAPLTNKGDGMPMGTTPSEPEMGTVIYDVEPTVVDYNFAQGGVKKRTGLFVGVINFLRPLAESVSGHGQQGIDHFNKRKKELLHQKEKIENAAIKKEAARRASQNNQPL